MNPVAESIETLERLGFELIGIVPGAKIRDDGGAIMVRTGAKAALCNGVFRIRWDSNSMEREIDRYAAEFARTCGYRRLCTTGTPQGMGIYRRAPLTEVGSAQRWTWRPS